MPFTTSAPTTRFDQTHHVFKFNDVKFAPLKSSMQRSANLKTINMNTTKVSESFSAFKWPTNFENS